MRLALRIAYQGTKFFGFAFQPKLRTVEGDLMKQVRKIVGVKASKEMGFQVASRTDRGVSAGGNVIAFNTPLSLKETVYSLIPTLEDIWVMGMTEVEEDFQPRHATMRWYRYFLVNPTVEIKKMREAARVFIGEHDFTNFAKIEKRDPHVSIDTIDITKEQDIILVDIKAPYFLWHQVRRIVSCLEKIGMGKITVQEIQDALEYPQKRKSFGTLPSMYLLLVDIEYKNIGFQHIPVSQELLEHKEGYYRTQSLMFEMMSRAPKF